MERIDAALAAFGVVPGDTCGGWVAQLPLPGEACLVTVTVSVAGAGTASGGAYATAGTVQAKALAARGYKFSKWTDNGHTVGASPIYKVNATSKTTLVAYFGRAAKNDVEVVAGKD